jgi:hypothetical protein
VERRIATGRRGRTTTPVGCVPYMVTAVPGMPEPCLRSTQPLSPSQGPPSRGGQEEGSEKQCGVDGHTRRAVCKSLGHVPASQVHEVAGIGQRDTAEAGFESCHCFFELSSANARRVDTQRTQGIASVAREFTGTDRPRVNPECRTHGPCRSKTAPDHRAVGFPSRPGGQGHFPGCIPSS